MLLNCDILKKSLRLKTNSRQTTILVIEDSKIINAALMTSLENEGFQCSSSYTLSEAVLNLQNKKFEYIILDLTLPDAEGIELIKKIKALSDAKIIVLTSSKDNSLREFIFQFGILDYLSKEKPLEKNVLDIKEKINKIEQNKHISILIVDDSSLIRTQLNEILTPHNYKLHLCKNGIDAYQILKTQHVDLVILDLELPDTHGLQLLNNIQINISKNLPVIILSGNASPENYRNCLQAGAVDFIKKPFIIEELLLKTDIFINNKLKSYELECSQQLLSQYRDTVDVGSIVSKTNSKGIITYVNKQFEEISGYTASELIGKPHNTIRHPDMKSEVFKELWHTISVLKKPWKGKVKNRKKNGDSYYVSTVINPILDMQGNIIEYIGIRSDITEIEKTKEHYKSQYSLTSDKFEDIFKLSQVYEDAIDKSSIVIRLNTDMSIKYVNQHFCELTGYTEDELIEKPYSMLKHHDVKQSTIDEIFNEVDQSGMWKGQLKGLTKEGKEINFITTVVAIKDKNDKTFEYLAIRSDITRIIELHNELDETQREVIYKMGEIGETRSKETGNHVKRVAEYSKLLALKAGLSKEEAELLKLASPMHDIGKVAIPDAILNKPGRYTPEEHDEMKRHTTIGFELLNNSDREILQASSKVAYEHHEKWDGTGYPQGLKGEDIHIYGRITAVCDVFDALAHDRVYKKAWELDRILDLFNEEKGKQFDPRLIDIFMDNLDEFLSIKEQYK